MHNYTCIYLSISLSLSGTNGVSTHGFTANSICFDRGTFWVPICQNLTKSDNCCILVPPDEIKYFCSGPTSVDPIRIRKQGP